MIGVMQALTVQCIREILAGNRKSKKDAHNINCTVATCPGYT